MSGVGIRGAIFALLAFALATAAFATGHGPVYGIATPTLGKRAWSLDLGLMSRFVAVEKIRQVVIDSGFTPKDAEAEIVGKIVEHNGKPVLAVAGSDLVYLLADHRRAKGKVTEIWKKAQGKDVVVRGHLPETTTKGRAEKPRVLEVLDFALSR